MPWRSPPVEVTSLEIPVLIPNTWAVSSLLSLIVAAHITPLEEVWRVLVCVCVFNIQCLLYCFSTLFFRQSLMEPGVERSTTPPHPRLWEYGACTTVPGLFSKVGAGDLNSDPHSCAAGTYHWSPQPQPVTSSDQICLVLDISSGHPNLFSSLWQNCCNCLLYLFCPFPGGKASSRVTRFHEQNKTKQQCPYYPKAWETQVPSGPFPRKTEFAF